MAKKTSTKSMVGVISIVFGIVIIIFPQLLQWLVGLYLIITGIMQLAK